MLSRTLLHSEKNNHRFTQINTDVGFSSEENIFPAVPIQSLLKKFFASA